MWVSMPRKTLRSRTSGRSRKRNQGRTDLQIEFLWATSKGEAMRRQNPRPAFLAARGQQLLEGRFLGRVDWAFSRWQPRKSFLELRFVVLQPRALEKKRRS